MQVPRSHADQTPGGYWSKPTIDEIKAMSRAEQSNVKDFTVGCKNSGQIIFSKVDFSQVPLDKLFGDLVDFKVRQVSVYGDDSTVAKPPRGQGLNVPSIITLANSWPRSNAGATEVLEKKGLRFDKHVNRLKRIEGTEFVNYNSNTGEWTFKVQHYTTYGLPDDFEDESMLDDSILSPAQDLASPTPLKVAKLRQQLSSPAVHSDASLPSPPDSSPDDTFDFKKGKRKHLPGQFDDEVMDDMEMYEEEEEVTGSLSFLGQRSVGSSVADAEDANELGLVADLEMVGSFPAPARTTEQTTAAPSFEPKSILKNSTMHGTPLKSGSVFFGDDWKEQLQRTVSPKKQDRAALRASQAVAFKSPEHEPTPKAADRKQPFATSMDIMNSLFNQSTRTASPVKSAASNLGTEVC
jgi:nuclear pore complex protein Nup98-Nup96